ncbi:transcriptional regulator [Candidatus Bathyarchaeota archaeon]|nr:transcriptional regulator [Candidatus Bathyarchaeota archaeon]
MHRSRLTILVDVLKTTMKSKKGKKKTGIMQDANLNSRQATKYLHLLLANGLLNPDSKERYRPTQKGLELVHTLEALNLKLR